MDKINLNEVYLNHFPEDDSNEIYFEPISLNGLDEMHEYSVKEEFYEFFEFEPFKTINETKQYLKKLINRTKLIYGDIQAMYWFVRLKDGNHLLGTAALVNINKSRESAEIGYGIDPSFWGKGYILKLQNALINFSFNNLRLNRLYGITMHNNIRTINSIYSSGFKKEGILRDYYLKHNTFIDGLIYSMTRDDHNQIFAIKNKNLKVKINELIDLVKIELKEEIDENSNMLNTSNWDSLSHLGIIVAISEKFKIEFNPIDISNASSIKSILEICNKEE